MRYALLLLLAAGMFVLRAEWFYAPRAQLVIPFLSSILMFRVVLYNYEINLGQVKAHWTQQLAYFFMFPNLVFLLYPIVDYKTFVNNWKPENNQVVQEGIRSLTRGLMHLLVYRFVYYYLLPSPTDVTSVLSMLEFMVLAYVMILRLSGMFHMAVGFLQIFGYDLPPVFNNFFLADSFSNIWRRENIYWREFMMKVFYYPLFFRIKGIGPIKALIATIMLVFVITWLLHSYQWFWIQGTHLFSANNVIYWMVLGAAITGNSVIQHLKSRKKTLTAPSITSKHIWRQAFSIVGIFLFMSAMWSFWSSPTIADWTYMMSKIFEGTATEYAITLGVLLLAALVLATRGYILLNKKVQSFMKESYQKSVLVSSTQLLALFALFGVIRFESSPLNQLTVEGLNHWDQEMVNRGYYEGILGNNRPQLWELQIDVARESIYDPITERVDGLRFKVLQANLNAEFKGQTFTTNQWGMRDREYTLEKPPGVCRIALLGGSYEMGSGVGDGEAFESLVEQRMNEAGYPTEILNFGIGGYDVIQQVSHLDNFVTQFNPDHAFLTIHMNDEQRCVDAMARLIYNGRNLEYDGLGTIKEQSGAYQSMSETELRQRLAPFGDDILTWVFHTFEQLCSKHSIQAHVLVVPAISSAPTDEQLQRWQNNTQSLHWIILKQVFDGYNMADMVVSESDDHPNAKGHKAYAAKLFDELVKSKLCEHGSERAD